MQKIVTWIEYFKFKEDLWHRWTDRAIATAKGRRTHTSKLTMGKEREIEKRNQTETGVEWWQGKDCQSWDIDEPHYLKAKKNKNIENY